MNIIYIAIKNVTRKAFRSIALILSVTLVSGLLFAGAVSMKGVLNSIQLGTQRLGADLMVVPEGQEEKVRSSLIAGKPSVFYMPQSVLESVRKVKGIKSASPQLFMKSTKYPCCTDVDVLLIAFEPSTDFTITPWLQEAVGRPLKKDEIIIGRSIPVEKGEQMTFYWKALTVAGYLSETGLEYIDNGVFMTMETARDMIRESKKKAVEPLQIGEDSISTVLVQLEPEISPERAAVFVEYEIKGVKAIASQEVIGSVKKQLFVLLRMIMGIGLFLWIITLVMITVVFSMIVNERQREIGILRALGAKKREIFSLITVEAVIISMIGGVTGIAAGGGLLLLLKKPIMAAFRLPYLWPDKSFVILALAVTLFLSTITGVVAVFYPAFRCSRKEPYEAIRQGE
jgi:putative ABC transport system permease protein